MATRKELQTISRLFNKMNWRVRFIVLNRIRYLPMRTINKYLPKEGNILEIGCGYGANLHYLWLKSPNRKLTGIDISLKRIMAAKTVAKNNENIGFLVSNATNLTLEAESYDGILICELLDFLSVDEQIELLKTCHKSLKSNGVLLVKDLVKDSRVKYMLFYCLEITVIKTYKLIKAFLSIFSSTYSQNFRSLFEEYFGSRENQNRPNVFTKQQLLSMIAMVGFNVENVQLPKNSSMPQVMFCCSKVK